MANIRLIKRRIRSAKNISQITKAMELVAASKMKKAQAAALSGKLYAEKIYEMVVKLARKVDNTSHPLLTPARKLTGKRMVVLISTNKGLCGGLNTTLFRFLIREYPDLKNIEFVTLGKKGAMFLTITKNMIKADYSETVPFITTVPALTELIVREFTEGRVDGVDLVYNEFISALKQNPRKKTIVPLSIEKAPIDDDVDSEFLIEPDAKQVFNALIPHYLENQIRDAVLQADASEHSARMVAMRNATDNANSFISELTLLYNKARQEKITYEISDIVTARIALE